jgi:peptidase E
MTTKYILVGGYPQKGLNEGKDFAEELVKDFGESVNILVCLFARTRDVWEKAYNQDVEAFQRHLPEKKLEIVMADPKKFIEQLKAADVLYLRGGSSTQLLVDTLKWYPDLKSMLQGKTVAGSSAGADAISQYYYGLDTPDEIKEGLGLLPVKVVVHYRSDYNAPNIDWDKVDALMENTHPEFPTLNLAEGQFEVMTAQ